MIRSIKYLLFVSLLISGFLITMRASALARAARTEVTGVSDVLTGIVGGEVFTDGNGKLHLMQVAFAGGFALQGSDIDIQGNQVLVLTGILDETLSGPASGSFVVTSDVGGAETVIWAGSVHGYLEQLSFNGQVVAQGEGPYAGLQLKLQMQEIPSTPDNPNPEVFDLNGSILDPFGSE